ncbi:type VI secretion system protein TssA [Vibrio maritimus]|uniref:type VI secretion system protein TssA n=1 Tax=Vibrio maritimus TaxID=990268 RepID=UPI001F198CE7|nr:type VI secretion system protein TssA [Vibrio maritimus]
MSIVDLDKLLSPISDGCPCGEDARYEFCYEMMEAEVKKFGSLFGETVDWSVVKTHAMEVLEKHSKDIKALCYLIRALTEESGLDGFKSGLELLVATLEQFGAELYPRRKRGRDGAVEWINHQFSLVSTKLSETPQSWELISACVDEVGKVQSLFDKTFEDSESDFFEIRTQLNTLMQQATADSQLQEPDPKADDSVASAEIQLQEPTEPQTEKKQRLIEKQPLQANSQPSKCNVPAVEVDTDFTSPAASKRTLKNVAEVLINADASSALAYRIYRHLTWDDIDGLPDHQNQITPLSLAVSADQQANYKDKAKQESDIETLKKLERTLTDAPFWLTGHFYVYSMLNNLGFADAAHAVKHEVRQFIHAFDGLETLEFKNSIPFADEETRQWLSAKDGLPSNDDSTVRTVFVTQEDSLQTEDITLDNLGEHAAELARKLELDSSGRGQFVLHLQLIAAYQSVGLFPLCLPYLKRGWEIQKVFNLASWEPHLSMQLETLIRKTLQALYENKELLPVEYEEWQAMYD